MKFFTTVIAFVLLNIPLTLFGAEAANGKVIDQEMSQFADALAAQVRKSGAKKITILDLTDIQGNTIALGAFIAEETTVNLVSSTNTFAVVDRANLNKILAEHKLSRTGLEQPENVKKLGHFSGVDAIVLGTITAFSDEVKFSAKVISTETADILGAAKGRLPITSQIGEMLLKKSPAESAKTNTPDDEKNAPTKIQENSKQIGDLLFTVESLKYTGDQYAGSLLATVVMKNTNKEKTIGAALFSISNVKMESRIHNVHGDEFDLYYSGVAGIPVVLSVENMKEIGPGDTIEGTLKYSISWRNRGGNFGPYRLQADVVTGDSLNGRFSNVKKSSVLITIQKAQ